MEMKIEDTLDLIQDPYLKRCSFLYLDKLKLMGFDHAPASRNIITLMMGVYVIM